MPIRAPVTGIRTVPRRSAPTKGSNMTVPVRQYAGIAGIIVLALGVIGVIARLITGSDYLFNLINVSWTENLIHLITGGLMAYVAYKQSDTSLAKSVVGVLGFIYLLVFVVSLFSSTVFGLIGSGLTLTDNLVHLVLGLAGIYVAYIAGTAEQLKV
jgi:hypothetical protein